MIATLLKNTSDFEKNWDLAHFPNQCLEFLDGFDYSLSFDQFETEVASWLSATKKLPSQVNLYNSFGEPPVTIFNNDKFAVDIYFWRKNNTLIHSHAFRGAFKVLYGQSLHEQFDVEILDSAESDICLSTLSESKKIIMNPGDSQIINPGMDLVHKVVHLENPTVTLCLRTVNDVDLVQWHHLPTGVSYQKHNITEETIKKILYFEFLYNSNKTKGLDFLNKLFVTMTASALLDLYEAMFVNEMGLSYETTPVVIEQMQLLLKSKAWYRIYNNHFENAAKNLDEHNLDKPELRLLAHCINSNYSSIEAKRLLKEVTSESVEDLVRQLLIGPPIFNEDYYDLQIDKVETYFK